MKQISQYFLIALLIAAFQLRDVNLFAQSKFANSKGSISLTYSGLGTNYAIFFESIDGGGAYESNGYNSFGITYVRPITSRIDIETGISYSKYKYIFSNASLGPEGPIPYEILNTIIDIPLIVRWSFLKHFFLNGGLSLGFDTEKENHLDNQTGIGTIIGAGAKYDINNVPIGLFINPFYKIHSLIPFQKEGYHRRALENGIRFGFVYYIR